MPQVNLDALQKEHNTFCTLKGLGYSLLAVVTWLFSFGFIAVAAVLVGWGFGVDWLIRWRYAIAGAAMIVLLVEGIRYAKPMVSSEAWMGSPLEATGYSDLQARRFAGAVFVLTHIMFAAPRSTVKAIREFGSYVHCGPAARAASQRALARLAEEGGWIPEKELGLPDNVVSGLARMKTVWLRDEGVGREVHLSPSIKREYFGDPGVV